MLISITPYLCFDSEMCFVFLYNILDAKDSGVWIFRLFEIAKLAVAALSGDFWTNSTTFNSQLT